LTARLLCLASAQPLQWSNICLCGWFGCTGQGERQTKKTNQCVMFCACLCLCAPLSSSKPYIPKRLSRPSLHQGFHATLTGLGARLGKRLVRTVGKGDELKQVRRRNAIKGDIGSQVRNSIPAQVEGIVARLLPVFYFQQIGCRLFLEGEGLVRLQYGARETGPLVNDDEIVNPNADALIRAA